MREGKKDVTLERHETETNVRTVPYDLPRYARSGDLDSSTPRALC